MFLKLTLIFLVISIQKSMTAFVKLDRAIPDYKIKYQHHQLIPIRCGLECILQCSIGNHQLDFRCFDKCLHNLPSVCQQKKSLKKGTVYKIEEMKGIFQELHQLKNVTIGKFCSVPCRNDEKVVPEKICNLCKNMPDWAKDSTVGTICSNDPCSVSVSITEKFCDFCKFINDLENVEEDYVKMQDNSMFLGRQTLNILSKMINFHILLYHSNA